MHLSRTGTEFGQAFVRAWWQARAVEELRERPYFAFLWVFAAGIATVGLHAIMWVTS